MSHFNSRSVPHCEHCHTPLCADCGLCAACCPAHYDGFDGKLHAALDGLDDLMRQYAWSPGPHDTAISILLTLAKLALDHVLGLTMHPAPTHQRIDHHADIVELVRALPPTAERSAATSSPVVH